MSRNQSSAYSGAADDSAKLQLVYFGLFDNCNVRCNMCECWRLPRSVLPLDHYQKVLTAVLALKPRAIRFTGGEPLLFKDLPALVRQATDAGVRVSVISNGRILGSKLSVLAQNGCKEIVLSIDGVGATHDSIRGTSGLFDHCLKAIHRLSELAMPYGVNTVVQARGAPDIVALSELLHSAPTPPTWWHIIPVRGNTDLQLDSADKEAFQAIVPSLRRRMKKSNTAVIIADNLASNIGIGPCTVPIFTMYVRADTGELFGCNMLAYASHSIGNIVKDTPEDAWNGSEAISLRRRCSSGTNAACGRCDAGSKAMNFYLRDLSNGTQ